MKKTLAFLLFILSFNLLATEIQCKTDIEGVDAVIKKSPQTEVYYLLIFKGEEVNPVPLTNNAVEDTPPIFRYNDEQLSIEINLETQKGTLEVTNESKIQLSACFSSDSQQAH